MPLRLTVSLDLEAYGLDNMSLGYQEMARQGEVILLEQILLAAQRAEVFINGQPILFVLATGLFVALIHVIMETITYWLARLGGRPLVFRFSRWLRVDIRHLDRVEALFGRWGIRLVLFGRIIPGVRTLVSVPAGITRMNFGLFLGTSLGGAYLWNTLMVAIAYLFGFKLTMFGISIF